MSLVRSWAIRGLAIPTVLMLGIAGAGCATEVTPPGSGGAGGSGASGGSGGSGAEGGAGGSTCTPGTEICDKQDNDCDGVVDNVADLPGGCACTVGDTQDCYSGAAGTEGLGTCKKGSQSCEDGAWGACTGEVIPADETCNLLDDDCDGTADDMGQATCGVGACAATVEKCVNGQTQTCVPGQPAVEVCDGADNNCNQLTDEADPQVGQSCMTGSAGACAAGTFACNAGVLECEGMAAAAEICDGIDNDCDGIVDNNIPGTGGMCATGALGVCAAGMISCALSAGSWQVDCYSLVMPSVEVCDGLDNNCDGQNDEGDPGGGGVCDTGAAGICGPGVLHCVAGSVQCVANQMATAETCNGADDNCDGQVDEGNPGGGLVCGTNLPGACAQGITSCTNGAVVCNQTVMAMPETCNGADDNCNGQTDEGNPGGGATCNTNLQGVCAAGTITCQNAALGCQQNVQPSAEVCGNAVDENCDGVAVSAPTVYFNETFANNAAGWTLDTPWAIGPTVMSAPTGSCGLGDPAEDHTPTADNGVAGTVLGGNLGTAIGGPWYLTSPIINTAAAPTLFLEYWRWLHSDYPNFMFSRVEVYNGSAWITVYNNPNSTVVNDQAWTKVSHDVTAHKNANFRVRFSSQIGSTGVFLCAGWNVDDVQLVNAQCN